MTWIPAEEHLHCKHDCTSLLEAEQGTMFDQHTSSCLAASLARKCLDSEAAHE